MGNIERAIFIWGYLLLFVLGINVCAARADFLTFDCTLPADLVTGAKIQIGTDPPVDAVLVSTCGTDPTTKVTCTDPASKTICHPAPPGAFVAKALVYNVRDSSAYSPPLSVPGIPGSPSFLRRVK